MGNYALALPRYILLLEEYLPCSVGRALRHSLLVCPSGRPGHFVAKDFYLEMQNYWLKYFYNHSVCLNCSLRKKRNAERAFEMNSRVKERTFKGSQIVTQSIFLWSVQ